MVLDGTKIPSISEKSLGKLFDHSLRDAGAIRTSVKEMETWLSKVDKSALPGKLKSWVYKHRIMPQILWPLLKQG